MGVEQAIILLRGAISSIFYTAAKPNVLCFNGNVSGRMKNENAKREKTPRTAEFDLFGASRPKAGNMTGEGAAVLCAHAH